MSKSFIRLLHDDPLWNASKFIFNASWNTLWSKEHWIRDTLYLPGAGISFLMTNAGTLNNLSIAISRSFIQSHPFITAGIFSGGTALVGALVAFGIKFGRDKQTDDPAFDPNNQNKYLIADGLIVGAITGLSFGTGALINHLVR